MKAAQDDKENVSKRRQIWRELVLFECRPPIPCTKCHPVRISDVKFHPLQWASLQRESWGWPLEGWELPRSAKGWARAFRLTCAGPGRPRLPGMQQALQWLAGNAPLSPPTRPHRFTPPSCSGHSATHLPARQHTQSLAGKAGLAVVSTDSACDFSEALIPGILPRIGPLAIGIA